MCGRARVSIRRQELLRRTGIGSSAPSAQHHGVQDGHAPADDAAATGGDDNDKNNDLHYTPSVNLAPGGWMPVIITTHKQEGTEGSKQHATRAIGVTSMKWGLVPSFTKPGDKVDHWRMFNARSETLASSPVFRRLLRHKRCLVLLNGFYEWKQDAGGRKQPYYIHLEGTPYLVVAALWDAVLLHRDSATPLPPASPPLRTVTLLTTDACPSLGWLHDRMPVILSRRADAEAWLGAALPDGWDIPFPGGDGEGTDKQAHDAAISHHHDNNNDNTANDNVDVDDDAENSLVARVISRVCHPYTGPGLAWHPVTPELTKMSYQAPDAWQDVRKKRGSLASFFQPSPAKAKQPKLA